MNAKETAELAKMKERLIQKRRRAMVKLYLSSASDRMYWEGFLDASLIALSDVEEATNEEEEDA